MKHVKNEQGSTLVELIMVMLLLVLFGATIFTLIFSGTDTQRRIMSEKDQQMHARVALSYINVRLRQNDEKEKISVTPNAVNGNDSILIEERSEEGEYDTWIYWANGRLFECTVLPGQPPEEIKSSVIADIEGFTILYNQEEGSITSRIQYMYDTQTKEVSSTIFLRSHQ